MPPLVTPEVIWWALVPLLVLSAGGFLLLTIASLVRRLPDALPQAWTVITGLVVLVATIPMWDRVQSDGPRSFLGGTVAVDGSTVLVTAILAIAVVATALLARPYLEREDLPGVELYVLLLLSAAGGVVMASADDLIVLFLGPEILSIAAYVMAALHLRRLESHDAPLKSFTPRASAPASIRRAGDFVRRGGGAASGWAARAGPGHEIGVAGPGRGYQPAPDATHLLLAGDETALSAIIAIAAAVPPPTVLRVLVAVPELAVHHIGDGLETAMRVVRRALGLAWPLLYGAPVVPQQERSD